MDKALMDMTMLFTGETPLLLFIFLAFAMLVLMFYLFLRALDDFRKSLAVQRTELTKDMDGVLSQLEDLIRVQYEQLGVLRELGVIAPDARTPQPPSRTAQAKPAGGNGTQTQNQANAPGNITDFILDE